MMNRYSDLVLDNRLRALSKAILESRRNPRACLLEAAMFIGDSRLIGKVYNLSESFLGLGRQIGGPGINTNLGGFHFPEPPPQKAPEAPAPKEAPAPANVEELKAKLKDVIVGLMKQGVAEKDINDMVATVFKHLTPPPIMKPEDFGDPAAPEADYDPTIPAKKKRVPTDPVKPSWYDHMTNAEKAWYEALPPDQKKRFVGMHDRDHGGVIAGHQNVAPEDHGEVDKIANGIASRSGGKINPKDAWVKAAGIWNRHKIRQQMAGKIRSGRAGTPLAAGYEDLLHKDHKKHAGQILDEWCLLAGIEPEKKRKKR